MRRQTVAALTFLVSCVLTFLVSCALSLPASALPRFSLTAGSRCSNCHVNPQGSGLRTDLGWYAMNRVGAVTWDKLGLKSLHELESNSFWDGKIVVGVDSRYQFARKSPDITQPDGKVALPDHVLIPMQLAPGVAFMPVPSVTAQAQVNIAGWYGEHLTEQRFHYIGQTHWDAWLRWAPGLTLPYVRAGVLQPSVGVRHDDHTIQSRANAFAPKQPLLAPYWNDLGVEVGYEGKHWLNVELAAFSPSNLANSVGNTFIADNALGWSGRLTLWPRLEDFQVNGMLGGSVLGAGNFRMEDVFVGIGKSYWGSLIGEFTHSSAGTDAARRRTFSGTLIAAYPFREWLTLEGRVERSIARQLDRRAKTDAYVVGVQFMPIPFVELRPEYRYIRTNDYTAAQYTMQLHLYF